MRKEGAISPSALDVSARRAHDVGPIDATSGAASPRASPTPRAAAAGDSSPGDQPRTDDPPKARQARDETVHTLPFAPRQPKPRWRAFFDKLGAAPDPDLVEAGLRGEGLIASIRLLLMVALLYVPLSYYRDASDSRAALFVIWLAVGALAEALIIYSAVLRSWGRTWIGFISGVLDVTLVSLMLWVFYMLNMPLTPTHDSIIFPVYLLAIGATSMRYDWRICVLTGVMAVLQYSGLIAYGVLLMEINNAELYPDLAARFQWPLQTGRLALLGLATALSTVLVVRARELRQLSTRDRLTQLANRGFFDESLKRTGAIAGRTGEPVTVAMMDVDHFKRFNDTYGHLVGDEALRTVARVLGQMFRSTDLVARYGGEEFACIFPGMAMVDAKRRLEQVRETIAKTPVKIDDRGHNTQITMSIGVAVWPRDGVTVQETLAIADLRLYQAKSLGRNRVVISGDGKLGQIDTDALLASGGIALQTDRDPAPR
ncbi:MAG: diguanylate cyclase [Acidobacteriota bacterium]